MPSPRIKHHRGRHIRYCHTCGERLEDGDLIVRIWQMGYTKTTKYRKAQERPPLEYHDLCYEDGE